LEIRGCELEEDLHETTLKGLEHVISLAETYSFLPNYVNGGEVSIVNTTQAADLLSTIKAHRKEIYEMYKDRIDKSLRTLVEYLLACSSNSEKIKEDLDIIPAPPLHDRREDWVRYRGDARTLYTLVSMLKDGTLPSRFSNKVGKNIDLLLTNLLSEIEKNTTYETHAGKTIYLSYLTARRSGKFIPSTRETIPFFCSRFTVTLYDGRGIKGKFFSATSIFLGH
jgi:hypothetical protein